MKPIALLAEELDDRMNAEGCVLLDIREEYEYEDDHLESLHIPMADVKGRISELEPYSEIIVCCNSGNRAKPMTLLLMKTFADKNITYLEGGMKAYRAL